MTTLLACLSDKAIDTISGAAFGVALALAAGYAAGAYFKSTRR